MFSRHEREEEELKEEYKAITYKINSDSFGLSNKESLMNSRMEYGFRTLSNNEKKYFGWSILSRCIW